MPAASDEPERKATELSNRSLAYLTALVAEVRTAVSRLRLASAPALDVLEASECIGAVREIFHDVSRDDPLDCMPRRRQLGDWDFARTCLLPLLSLIHNDDQARESVGRWAAALYHTVRLLSLLCVPVDDANILLHTGCTVEMQLMDLKQAIASDDAVLQPIVELLQYYMERKARKIAEFGSAEDAKIDDARIDNLLRLFRNLLMPPREHVPSEISKRDRGVHIALVGAMESANLYKTLSIMFTSEEDAVSQQTNVVSSVAEIYALSFRHTAAAELVRFTRSRPRSRQNESPEPSPESPAAPGLGSRTMDALTSSGARPDVRDIASSAPRPKAAARTGLMSALQKERTLVGGTRSVVASARWTTRHSGGLRVVSQRADEPSATERAVPLKPQSLISKRILSVRSAVSTKRADPERALRAGLATNSQILCHTGARARAKVQQRPGSLPTAHGVRADLQVAGMRSLVQVLDEFVAEPCPVLLCEVRARFKSEVSDKNDRATQAARTSYLALVAVVAGYAREKAIAKSCSGARDKNTPPHLASIHNVAMCDALVQQSGTYLDWSFAAPAVSLASFKYVFDCAIDAREDNGLKKHGYVATAAIKEMMQVLQMMATRDQPLSQDNVPSAPHSVNNGVVNTTMPSPESEDSIRLTIRPICNAVTPNSPGEGEQSPAHVPLDGQPEAGLKDHPTSREVDGETPEPSTTVAQTQDKTLGRSAPTLTDREIALNTLEELFENPAYLEVPAMLAREFNPKRNGFRQLANTIEIAYSFVCTLLGEDFARITVSKRQRPRRTTTSGGADAKGQSEPSSGNGTTANQTRGTESTDAPNRGATQADASAILAGSADAESPRAEHDEARRDSVGDSLQAPDPRADKPGAGHGASGDAEDAEPTLRTGEVEGTDVIRRFATPRTIHNIALAVRAALCSSSSISGSILPMPEGSHALFDLAIVSKAVSVMRSVWEVIGSRERGAFRGAFFTVSMLQLLGVAMSARDKTKAGEDTILGSISQLGADVSEAFYGMMDVSPVLVVDSLFYAEVNTLRQYARKHKTLRAMREEEEAIARGEIADSDASSSDDSGVNDLRVSRRDVPHPRQPAKRARTTAGSGDESDMSPSELELPTRRELPDEVEPLIASPVRRSKPRRKRTRKVKPQTDPVPQREPLPGTTQNRTSDASSDEYDENDLEAFPKGCPTRPSEGCAAANPEQTDPVCKSGARPAGLGNADDAEQRPPGQDPHAASEHTQLLTGRTSGEHPASVADRDARRRVHEDGVATAPSDEFSESSSVATSSEPGSGVRAAIDEGVSPSNGEYSKAPDKADELEFGDDSPPASMRRRCRIIVDDEDSD